MGRQARDLYPLLYLKYNNENLILYIIKFISIIL